MLARLDQDVLVEKPDPSSCCGKSAPIRCCATATFRRRVSRST